MKVYEINNLIIMETSVQNASFAFYHQKKYKLSKNTPDATMEEFLNFSKTQSKIVAYYLQVLDPNMTYKVLYFKEAKKMFYPMIINFSLYFVEQGDDDSKLNIQWLIIIKVFTDGVIDCFEEIVANNYKNLNEEDFEEKHSATMEKLEEMLHAPHIRINEKPYNLGEDLAMKKDLYMNGKKVGVELTFRSIIEGLYLDFLEDIDKFPFDEQKLEMKVEFTSKDLEGVTIKPVILDLKPEPDNLNKFNIFSVFNSLEDGTDKTEALDALDLYNNSTGYRYTLSQECENLSSKKKKKEYDDIFIYNSSVTLYINFFRNPVFEIKSSLFPMVILLFFASGVNFFGESVDQYSNLLNLYLAFAMFLCASSVSNIKTSKTTFIDMTNYMGYGVNCFQFIILVVNNYQTTFDNLLLKTSCENARQLGQLDGNGRLLKEFQYGSGMGSGRELGMFDNGTADENKKTILKFVSFWITVLLTFINFMYIYVTYRNYKVLEEEHKVYENMEQYESEAEVTQNFYINYTPYIKADYQTEDIDEF